MSGPHRLTVAPAWASSTTASVILGRDNGGVVERAGGSPGAASGERLAAFARARCSRRPLVVPARAGRRAHEHEPWSARRPDGASGAALVGQDLELGEVVTIGRSRRLAERHPRKEGRADLRDSAHKAIGRAVDADAPTAATERMAIASP
jgi:hypothetical protein